MLAKHALQLNVEQREALRHGWMQLFKRFEKAHRACERSLSEKRVHALRLAGRHCLPVLEVLRVLRPKEPIWPMCYHAVRDLLDVLGPLRDAQLRRSRLGAVKRRDRPINFLLGRAAAEEKAAIPFAHEAVALLQQLPLKLIKGRSGKELVHSGELEKAVASTLDRRRQRLLDRWSSISTRQPLSMHKARVALKRYRYLLVALEPCLNEELQKAMPKLERIQGAVGRWHDDQVFMDWLKQAGRSGAQFVKRTSSSGATRLKQLKPFLGRPAIA